MQFFTFLLLADGAYSGQLQPQRHPTGQQQTDALRIGRLPVSARTNGAQLPVEQRIDHRQQSVNGIAAHHRTIIRLIFPFLFRF